MESSQRITTGSESIIFFSSYIKDTDEWEMLPLTLRVDIDIEGERYTDFSMMMIEDLCDCDRGRGEGCGDEAGE